MANEVTKSTAQEMTAALTASRNAWLEAVNSGEPFAIALAEADAKLALLEQIKQQHVYALLARFCVAGTGMTEMVGNVSEHEAVRCTGLAILSGFMPGKDEYAIFAQKGAPAKVYVKEPGYRKLLSMIPGCVMGDVKVGYPQIQQLDANIEAWAVNGFANCRLNGATIEIRAEGEYAVRLPVKRSREYKDVVDNIDGIAAKARRRLVQMLWRKVTGSSFVDDANEADHENPDPETVIVVESTPQPKPQPALPPQEPAPQSWGEEASQIAAKVSQKSSEIMDAFYISLGDCTTIEELQKEWQSLQAVAKTDKPDQRVMQFLARFKDHRKSQLGG